MADDKKNIPDVALGKGQQLQQIRYKMLCCLAHVLGQILAVRAGIGQQLLFIELLGIIKGLLGGKSKQAVGLPLQGGEIVKTGGCSVFFSRVTDTQTACAVSQAAFRALASAAFPMRSLAASMPPAAIWTTWYFSFLKLLILASRSTSILRVGVWTRPTVRVL